LEIENEANVIAFPLTDREPLRKRALSCHGHERLDEIGLGLNVRGSDSIASITARALSPPCTGSRGPGTLSITTTCWSDALETNRGGLERNLSPSCGRRSRPAGRCPRCKVNDVTCRGLGDGPGVPFGDRP